MVANVVEVEFVVVALRPVKFCNVDEPVAKRFARVATPLDERVLNDAAPLTANTFVFNVVEVALVVVAFCAVTFWRVDDAYAVKPWPNNAVDDAWKGPLTFNELSVLFVAVKLVVKNEVEVAFVVVLLRAVKF